MELNLDKIKSSAEQKDIEASERYGDDFLKENFERSKVDTTTKYKGAKFIMYFVEDNGTKIPAMSLGNISATIGPAKSKKTFFSTMISAAFNSGNEFAFKSFLGDSRFLYVDTEQSRFHVQKIAMRICAITNMGMDRFDIIALREHAEPELRTAILEYAIKTGKYAFVIVDGLVDLIYDFNDLKESTVIVNKLMSWSEKYNCHINTILHTNKDKKNARGHLGTALMNKAETIIRVTPQDKFISVAKCDASRNRNFQNIEFTVNDNGLPVRCTYPDGYFNNEPQKDNNDAKEDLPF